MEVMKKFISYYKPYKTVFFLDMFCALVISAVDLAFPQILNYLNSTFYIKPKDMIMDSLLLLGAGLLVMYIVRALCRYYVTAQGHIMGARMESDMRQDLFDQFERLSFSYYDRNNTGEMMSKLVSDLFDISEFAHHGPENVFSSIKVSASAADDKAVVYGTGTKSLKPGKNTITVSVAAEDGSTKEYTITVNVDETPVVFVTYNGTRLGFVRSLDGVDKPAKSFEEVKIKVDGKEVKAWKSNLLKKTVVYLQDDKTKEKNYYIYNTETNTVETQLRPMALLGNNVFIVDVPKELQIREDMTFTTVKIDKYELNGWKFNDAALENYALLYVMDEKGNMVYYQYEATEKTLQIYSGAAAISQTAYDQYRKDVDASLKKHKMVIYGLSGGCVLLAGLSAFLFFRRKKTVKYQKRPVSGSGRDAEADTLRNISDD